MSLLFPVIGPVLADRGGGSDGGGGGAGGGGGRGRDVGVGVGRVGSGEAGHYPRDPRRVPGRVARHCVSNLRLILTVRGGWSFFFGGLRRSYNSFGGGPSLSGGNVVAGCSGGGTVHPV